jgi:hypothetical protein
MSRITLVCKESQVVTLNALLSPEDGGDTFRIRYSLASAPTVSICRIASWDTLAYAADPTKPKTNGHWNLHARLDSFRPGVVEDLAADGRLQSPPGGPNPNLIAYQDWEMPAIMADLASLYGGPLQFVPGV